MITIFKYNITFPSISKKTYLCSKSKLDYTKLLFKSNNIFKLKEIPDYNILLLIITVYIIKIYYLFSQSSHCMLNKNLFLIVNH